MKFEFSSKVMSAFIVLMSTAAFCAENASAIEFYNESGLLDVLKKNKAISERDMEAIKDEYPKLEIRGSFQFQYIKADADPGFNKYNEMDIRRLNLTFASRVTEKLSMLVEPEFGKNLPPIKDAYITYNHSLFDVYAGNHRVPFSAEALQNDINLRLVERNLTSQISPNRMPGVSVLKTMHDNKLIAQAGLWNANLSSKAQSDLINNNLADNQIFSTTPCPTGSTCTAGSNILIEAFRIGYASKGMDDFYPRGNGFNDDENFSNERSYDLGFSYYHSNSATPNNPVPGITGLNAASAYEVDAKYRDRRFSGEFEYAHRSLDWWQYNALAINVLISSAQTSYSLQASYLLNEKMSLVLRKEAFTYDGTGKVLKGAYGQNSDQWLTTGINFYNKEQNLKIQANYIWKHEGMPGGIKAPRNNTALIQATTYF